MNRHPNLQFTPKYPPHHDPPLAANVIVPPPQIPLPSMLSRKRKSLAQLQTNFSLHHSNEAVLLKDEPLPISTLDQRRSASSPQVHFLGSSRARPTHPHSPSQHPPLQHRIVCDTSLRRRKLPLFDSSDSEDDIAASLSVRNAHPKIWDSLLSDPLRSTTRKNFAFGDALVELNASVFSACLSLSDEDGPGQSRSKGHARAAAGVFHVSASSSSSDSCSVSRTSSATSLTIPLPEIVVHTSSVIDNQPFAATINLCHDRSLSPYDPVAPASLLKDNGYSSSSSASSTISSAGDETSSPSSALTTPSTSPESSFLPHLKFIRPSPLSSEPLLPQPVAPCVSPSRDAQHLDLLPVEPGSDPLSLEISSTLTNLINGAHASLPKRIKRPYRRRSAISPLGEEGSLLGPWDALYGFSKLFVDGYGASTLDESTPLAQPDPSQESPSSDPTPSVPGGNMVFTPWDVKPYGYRVGGAEVRTVFGHWSEEASPDISLPSTSETIMHWFDSALDFVNPPMDAAYGLPPSGSSNILHFSGTRGAFGPSIVPPLSSRRQQDSSLMLRGSGGRSRRKMKREGKRPSSPPLTAVVALQRYPVIPYNPPGNTKPWEEVFPKVRDISRIWWYDMMPASQKDFRIDGEVALSGPAQCTPLRLRCTARTPSRLQHPYSPSPSSSEHSRSPSRSNSPSSRSREPARRKRSPSSDRRGRHAGAMAHRRRSPSTHRRNSGSPARSSESTRGRSRIARPCYSTSMSSPDAAPKAAKSSATSNSHSPAPYSPSASLPSPALVKRKARLSSLRRPPSEQSFAPSIYYVWALKASLLRERNLAGVPALGIAAFARAHEAELMRSIPVESAA